MSSHSSVFFSQLASDFDGTVSRLLQTSAVCTTVITITISHKPTSSNCHRYHQFNALWILKGLESSSFNLVQVRKVQKPRNFFKSTPGGFWGVLCTATDVLWYIKCRRGYAEWHVEGRSVVERFFSCSNCAAEWFVCSVLPDVFLTKWANYRLGNHRADHSG